MQESRAGSIALRSQREVKNNHSLDCKVYSSGCLPNGRVDQWVKQYLLILKEGSSSWIRILPSRE
jgi:hypothetical protein